MKKEFKGTKGKWIIKDKPFFDGYSNVWKVAIYSDNLRFCQYIAGKTEEEALANAQLIATAPELLDIVIRASGLFDRDITPHSHEDMLINDMYSIINKALGHDNNNQNSSTNN